MLWVIGIWDVLRYFEEPVWKRSLRRRQICRQSHQRRRSRLWDWQLLEQNRRTDALTAGQGPGRS